MTHGLGTNWEPKQRPLKAIKKIRNSREQNRHNIKPITNIGERLDNHRVCRFFKKTNESNLHRKKDIWKDKTLIRVKVPEALGLEK